MPTVSHLPEHDRRALLRRVSRSFYLSLRWLPPATRGPMSLAYLLARASDTLADAGAWEESERRELLRELRAALQATTPHAREWLACLRVLAATAPAATLSDGERALLERLGEVLAWFEASPEEEKTLIRSVVTTIIGGQEDDLGRTRVASADELDHYTWQVAGCVGEFWTRLCLLKNPAYARGAAEPLIAHGIHFGQGLQLINILRDVPKDAALGRSYLPGLAATASAEEKWAAAQPWLARCADRLAAGRHYLAGINGFRHRLVVRLPLRLAEETLALLRTTGPAAMTAPVKVPRPRIKWLLLECAVKAAFPRGSAPSVGEAA